MIAKFKQPVSVKKFIAFRIPSNNSARIHKCEKPTVSPTSKSALCVGGADAKVIGIRLNRTQGKRPRNKSGIAVSVCRCRGCGLIFPNPLPRPQSLADHYGVPPESYWKAAYFENNERYFGKQIEDAKRLIGFRDGMTALDIGVGIGKSARALREANFDVWGIEPSEPFRANALEFTGLPGERIQLAVVEEAEFPDASFDFITFGAVLEHLFDPSEAIARSLAWLKPDGVIHIEVPSSDHLVSKIINLYYRLIGTNFVTNISRCIARSIFMNSRLTVSKKMVSAPATTSQNIIMMSRVFITCRVLFIRRFGSSWTEQARGCNSRYGCHIPAGSVAFS